MLSLTATIVLFDAPIVRFSFMDHFKMDFFFDMTLVFLSFFLSFCFKDFFKIWTIF